MAELPALAMTVGPSGYPLIAAAKALQAAGCSPQAVIELEVRGRLLSGRVKELAMLDVKLRGRRGMGLRVRQKGSRRKTGPSELRTNDA